MVMRQQVWIDRHVQGVLVGRVLLYWSGILIYFGLSIGCFHWWQNPEWTLSDHLGAMLEQVLPCLPTLLLLLPLVIFDIVRLSNRFAGPVHRLRKHLTDLTQDTHVSPLHFRDEDYWQQLAEPINSLQQKMLVLEQQVETLSLVRKSLADGPVPVETLDSTAETLDSTTAEPVPSPEPVMQEDVVHETTDVEPMPSIPPLPPLTSDNAQAFVSLDAR